MLSKLTQAIRGIGVKPLPVPEFERSETIKAAQKQTVKRNFNAARTDRFAASWISSDVALNALLESNLSIIRTRSRNLVRNTAIGKRFITMVKNNIVGPDGFRIQSRCGDYKNKKFVLDDLANTTIEKHLAIWSKPEHCDVAGQLSFAAMQRLWAETLARDGEVLIKEVIGTKNTPYRYQLQTLAIDRLDINYRGTAKNGNKIRMGVETDNAGKPVAVYVLVRNPNDTLGSNTQYHERIALTEVLHKFVKTDAEQLRGVPWAHAVMTGQNMLNMFQEAAVQAAVVGASSMGFYKPPAPGDSAYVPPSDGESFGAEVADAVDESGNLMKDAVGGAFETLPPGWEFEKFDPNYPHAAYQPFIQEAKRDIASGLDVAHHNLSGDMSGVNYSSARIAELNERDVWRSGQKFMIESLVTPIIDRWIELSLLAGALVMPNGSTLPATKLDKFKAGLVYVARGWDWVDPLKEANAAIAAIDAKLTTRSKVVASKGGDFEENIIELAREEELIRKYKLNQAAQASPAKTDPNLNNADGEENDTGN